MFPGVAISSPLRPVGPFGRLCDQLLVLELPDLPDQQRDDAVLFVCRRADQMPTPLRLGLVMLTFVVAAAGRVAGTDRTTRFLASTSLPFIGELARMVRSLAFAYVWETWPSTTSSGGQG